MNYPTTFQARPAASVATSLAQQFRLLAVSWRWAYLMAAFAAIVAAMMFTSARIQPATAMYVVAVVSLIGGAVWPLFVWRDEPPSGRTYHWSLPVPRAQHDLARIAAGLPYLLVGCAVLGAGVVLLAAANGTSTGMRLIGVDVWLNFLVAPLLVYLLVSPIALWSEYAVVRWVVGGWILFSIAALALGGVFGNIQNAIVGPVFFHETFGLANALMSRTGEMLLAAIEAPAEGLSPLWPAVALWLGIAVAANIFAATYRPDDLRRLLRPRP